MKKFLKMLGICSFCLFVIAFLFVGYAIQYSPKVIIGKCGGILNLKGNGLEILEIENKTTELQSGDRVISINGNAVECYGDLEERIISYQKNAEESITISYIREGNVYNTKIATDVVLGITSFDFNDLQHGYVSMIHPETYRYAVAKDCQYLGKPITIFSGFLLQANYDYEFWNETTFSSDGNIIGTVTNVGKKATYGYLEPFQYEEEDLVKIAPKWQVKSGKATMEFVTMGTSIVRVDVEIECQKDGIIVKNLEGDSFENLNIPGLPIFQNDKLVAIFRNMKEEKNLANANYAMDVYQEMIEIENQKK